MKFIKVYNNAFTDEYCDDVIKAYYEMNNKGHFEEAFNINENGFRNDKCIFMDKIIPEEGKKIEERKKELFNPFYSTVINYTNKYLKEFGQYDNFYLEPEGMKVHKYDHKKSGGYYVFHSERTNKGLQYLRRELVYTLYLNDIPEGEGETEFLYQGFRYQPKKGDLVMFPAGFTHTHRGNPVYTTDKYIVTGWMLRADPSTQETKTKDA